jgi:hypothetical protein
MNPSTGGRVGGAVGVGIVMIAGIWVVPATGGRVGGAVGVGIVRIAGIWVVPRVVL